MVVIIIKADPINEQQKIINLRSDFFGIVFELFFPVVLILLIILCVGVDVGVGVAISG